MADQQHELELRLVGGVPVPTIHCPFDRADRERPCWARNLDGTLDEDAFDYCNYVEWQENSDGGVLHADGPLGRWSLRAEWATYDALLLHVEAVNELAPRVHKDQLTIDALT